MMSQAEQQGYEAHEAHLKRTANPYLQKAIVWDRGWVKRQIQECEKAGISTDRMAFSLIDWLKKR